MKFRRFDAQTARTVRDIVALLHRDAYAEAIASGDPFESHEAFMQRFDAHTAHPALDLVIAYIKDEPVGQIWGWPEQPSGTGAETTFSLAEIMVRKAWTGQGIAHALHDELLGTRTEQQAELYVQPGNARAYSAYLKWGWRKVGQIRPDLPDAPVFDVLVLPLPLGRT